MERDGLNVSQKSAGSHSSVDAVLLALLAVRGTQEEREVKLLEMDIINLCYQTTEILLSQPTFLELNPPVNILGDIHGQYYDLLRWFEMAGYPPDANFLFLGDYVDRGAYGIEVMALLMAYKVKYPENFFLLRGNHESASLNLVYGFYQECKRRYSFKLWKSFTELFNCLPLAALIENKIFCCHGGLSPVLDNFNQIRQIHRPIEVPDDGLVCDLLWSDPSKKVRYWGDSERGVSYSFGRLAVRDFVRKHGVDLICRAHQVVEDGYEFFGERLLVTIFSAPNYCGEFDNAGGMMTVDQKLVCTFKILPPSSKSRRSSRTLSDWLGYKLRNQ